MTPLRLLVLLNLGCIIYYFSFISYVGWPSEEVMFFSIDSNSYQQVGRWIFGLQETSYTVTRPFLYPLIMQICMTIGGLKGLWIFQFLCWLGTINLTYFSLEHLTSKRWVAITGALIVSLNWTFIALTLHGLSDVTTTLVLSAFVYFVIRNWTSYKELWFFHGCLLSLMILSLLRPVFFPALIILLIAAFPLGYIRQYIGSGKQLIKLVLILMPLLIQMSIMKTRHDTFSISRIGPLTVQNYIFARVYGEQTKIPHNEAVLAAGQMSKSEQYEFAWKNKSHYAKRYLDFLYESIDGKPVFLIKPVSYPGLAEFMRINNKIVFLLHILLLIPTLLLILRFAIRRDEKLILFLCLALPFYLVIFTSGLSFWQGDRLVLPTLAIWVVLYVITIIEVLRLRERV